ncbi:conserved hypothetical protein [Talaromyces stipitatus ATCC 10500]|uniref:DUF427 domain-containing protein n=1 Tax=Talaromyces stipitatus (strain ATCC 10500 / CBS 375.48 / QM 6759 / NRRL 1006) TaxID=441959 RepID=B8M431_TALSN|nr:uncharacterized protein TSTA_039690 [Talaromyces stipitatus ATCC 10500]EED20774.1 conserved hypothetical protein [Talaromyces stipitatus ATCC 10500]
MPVPFPPAGHSEDVWRRVRAIFNGQMVVDANVPKLVWEHSYFPIYYFQSADIRSEYLTNKQTGEDADIYDLTINGKSSPSAVKQFKSGDLKGYFKIESGKVDAWFEEDERIFGHPKDPYKRIIILQSSKKVQIEIDGVEVASTSRPKLLYETGLPVRIYIPHTDVRLDLLEDDVDRTSYCPVKGDASYYVVKLPNGDRKHGLAWWYKTPKIESAGIEGHVAFYDEKVDVRVDGVLNQRPTTKFS